MFVPLILFHRASVAERARQGKLIKDAKEEAEKFGPLKVVLRAIPAVYADHGVRHQHPSHNPPLTSSFSGIHCY